MTSSTIADNHKKISSRHRLTVRDYHRMAEAGILKENNRVELIEGELFDMTPIGSKHADCVDRLNLLLVPQADEHFRVRIQNPVQLGEHTEPEPDVALVRNRSYFDAHPGPEDAQLIIEVAESSLDYDRNIKIPLYARYGIPEVWLIDLENEEVEIYLHPQSQGYRTTIKPRREESITPSQLPEISLQTAELFPTSSVK